MGALLTVLVASLPQAASACSACHERERRAEEGTVHAAGAASCVDCHGGDAEARDKAAAHAADVKGRVARAVIPALCARCHSDARRMNPFGLPTDQHAQYLTSKHGEALARGLTDAAVCTDCHAAHGVKRAKDPTSPVHPANVPSTCGRCHSDRALMQRHELDADAEADYRASLHAAVLRERGGSAAPHCATCHGNHGAAPPGFAEVGHVCGKCHVRELESFEASPHGSYAKEGHFKGCVVCHSSHLIVRSPEKVLRRCRPCHDRGDPELKHTASILETVQSARGDFQRTGERLAQLVRAGFFGDEEQLLLERARTSLLQLSPLQHTLDAAKVRAEADALAGALADVRRGLDAKERAQRSRKIALAPVWVLLGAMAWAFWAKRRRIEERHDG